MEYGVNTIPNYNNPVVFAENNNIGFVPDENFFRNARPFPLPAPNFINFAPETTNINNNFNVLSPYTQGARPVISWGAATPLPINFGPNPNYPTPGPAIGGPDPFPGPFPTNLGRNPTDFLFGNQRPDGLQLRNPQQIETYADTIGDARANEIITQNFLYEFNRRTNPNARLQPGPYSNLTNNQFYREGVEVRNANYDNAYDAYQLMQLNPAIRNDPRLRMSFNQDISNLGAASFIVSNMQQRGWNVAANTNNPRVEPLPAPAPTPNPIPKPLVLYFNPQVAPQPGGINLGFQNINQQNVYSAPFTTTPYVSNFNTVQTNPTYANFMLYNQPAWLN